MWVVCIREKIRYKHVYPQNRGILNLIGKGGHKNLQKCGFPEVFISLRKPFDELCMIWLLNKI